MGPESAFRAPHSKDMIRTALSISKAGFFRVRFQRRGGPLKGAGESQAPRARDVRWAIQQDVCGQGTTNQIEVLKKLCT